MEAKLIAQQSDAVEIFQQAGPVLLEFFATWCGPCQQQARIFERLEDADWQLYQADIDQLPALAQQYQVFSVPTLVFLRDGREIARRTGVQSAASLRAVFAEL